MTSPWSFPVAATTDTKYHTSQGVTGKPSQKSYNPFDLSLYVAARK